MTTAPGLARLTLVELRKMVDTRAGLWLQGIVVFLTLASVVVLCLLAPRDELSHRNILSLAVQPAALLLGVMAILLVTSEWSQRTAQVTFTLVPKRSRVIGAKLLAALVVALAAFAVSVAVALLATAIASPDIPGGWSLPAGELGQIGLLLGIAMVGGVAFGALLLASAPAIVAYFLAPTAWAALLTIPAFDDLAPWLDSSRSFAPMTEEVMSATEWAHVATTTALWIALPLALGIARIRRNEVP
jgi:ABC-2 type transport system permease protein